MKCDKFDKCSRVGKCNAKNICCELSLQELEEWAKGKDFDSIVDKAFYIDGCKKRYSHQYCIQSDAYTKYRDKIKELKDESSKAKNFHEILTILTFNEENNKFQHVVGIGELTEYDIALRIGVCLGIYPEKVYLHAGTRKGAKKLGIKNITGNIWK